MGKNCTHHRHYRSRWRISGEISPEQRIHRPWNQAAKFILRMEEDVKLAERDQLCKAHGYRVSNGQD